MAESSISVAIRVRPFSSREASQLAPHDIYQPFLGDGGLSGGSPAKSNSIVSATPASSSSTGPGLRTKYLRSIVSPVDDKVLIFDPPETNPLSRLYSNAGQNTFAHGTRKPRDVRYAFDRVFDDTCSQAMVFENTTKPLLDGILNGFNASVFAYGATGCGKTHTISGTPQDPGVIFLTMRELYNRIEESRDESDVQVRLSYLEIYNEQIRDLLSPAPTPPGSGLMLREDATNRISVVGITEHVPASPEHVLEMIQDGNMRRTMSPTEANAVSSRSHAVLQINVTQRPRTADTVMETTSASLNIIDLAGSERAAATRNNGARMKEGANINKSLLALGNCINALCQSGGQKGRHIPYRNSKLTRLLKFSLGGNCKTVMIVCVSPSSAHYDETHNTLKYANQAKNIRTKVSRNMLNVDRHVAQYVQAIHELKEEVAELKAKLADRASLESASEKRRKVEKAAEMVDVQAKMRVSTDNLKVVITQKAVNEALLLAASTRLAPLRQRLEELESAPSTPQSTATSSSSPSATENESEKQVVRKLIARQEAILADRVMLSEVQALTNSLQMHRGVMHAASNNTKFDEDATRLIRILGESMLSEVESHKAKMVCETMCKQLGAGMGIMADFAVLGARSTMALKEAAKEVDKVQNKPISGEHGAVGTVSQASSTTLLASQMRAVSRTNDDMFSRHVGLQTVEAPQSPVTLRASMLRRARSTASFATGPPPSAAGQAARVAATTTANKRTSMVLSSSGVGAGSLANSALNSKAAARRPSVRRSSVGVRRVSGNARRSSQVGGVADLSRGNTSIADALPQQPRKAFRWADEAGEGAIDDKKNEMASTENEETTVAPGAVAARAIAAAQGPSRAIRTSLSTNAVVPPPSVLAAPSLAGIRAEMAGQDAASSSAEWEDVSKEAVADAATEARKVPLASSALANSGGAAAMAKPSATAGTGKRREPNTLFERNFLRKKDGMTAGTTADPMDTEDSSIDSSLDVGGETAAVVEVGSSALLDGVMSSDDVQTLSSAYNGASVRSSPYQRRGSSTLNSTGGVGPIRSKGRTSFSGQEGANNGLRRTTNGGVSHSDGAASLRAGTTAHSAPFRR